RRRIEQELHRAKLEADRANSAKSEFLSRMSHDLRTPLNAILGFGQLLEIAPLEADDVQSVQQIMRAAHHLLSLINEVLEVARVESGQLRLDLEPVDVAEVCAESLLLLKKNPIEKSKTKLYNHHWRLSKILIINEKYSFCVS
ncbi:MAG: hypothetical protein EOO44_22765, partial [Flavobacterium sp.]